MALLKYYTDEQVAEIKSSYEFYNYSTNYFYKTIGKVLYRYSKTLSAWILELNRSSLKLEQNQKLNALDFEMVIRADPNTKLKKIAHPIEKVQLNLKTISDVGNQWIQSAINMELDEDQISILKSDFSRILDEELVGDYTHRVNKQTYFGLQNKDGEILTLVEVVYNLNGSTPLVKLMSISHRSDIVLLNKADYHSYHAKALGNSVAILLANTSTVGGRAKVYAEDQYTLEQLKKIGNGLTAEELVDKLNITFKTEGRFLTFARK